LVLPDRTTEDTAGLGPDLVHRVSESEVHACTFSRGNGCGVGREKERPARGAADRGARLVPLVTRAAVTAAASPPAAVAAAPAAPAPVFPGPGLVDGQAATVHLLAVEGRDGRLCLLVCAHFHETKPLGTAGVAVHVDLGGLHGPVRLKHRRQRAVR